MNTRMNEERTRMLEEPGMKAVTLFVAPTNPVAVRVYARVGFIGLDSGIPDEQTEEWAVIGWEEVEIPKRT
jgi:hypothetical protein